MSRHGGWEAGVHGGLAADSLGSCFGQFRRAAWGERLVQTDQSVESRSVAGFLSAGHPIVANAFGGPTAIRAGCARSSPNSLCPMLWPPRVAPKCCSPFWARFVGEFVVTAGADLSEVAFRRHPVLPGSSKMDDGPVRDKDLASGSQLFKYSTNLRLLLSSRLD